MKATMIRIGAMLVKDTLEGQGVRLHRRRYDENSKKAIKEVIPGMAGGISSNDGQDGCRDGWAEEPRFACGRSPAIVSHNLAFLHLPDDDFHHVEGVASSVYRRDFRSSSMHSALSA